MADLIPFPVRRPQAATAYQLHRFAPDGGTLSTLLILARDDTAARRQARGLAEGFRVELWSNGRFLDRFFTQVDWPVAASIRLLKDPAPSGLDERAGLEVHPPSHAPARADGHDRTTMTGATAPFRVRGCQQFSALAVGVEHPSGGAGRSLHALDPHLRQLRTRDRRREDGAR